MSSQNSPWPFTGLVAKASIAFGFVYVIAGYLYMFRYWGQ